MKICAGCGRERAPAALCESCGAIAEAGGYAATTIGGWPQKGRTAASSFSLNRPFADPWRA